MGTRGSANNSSKNNNSKNNNSKNNNSKNNNSKNNSSKNDDRQSKKTKTVATKTVAGKSVTVAAPVEPKSAPVDATQSSELDQAESHQAELEQAELEQAELEQAELEQAEKHNHAGQLEEIMATQEKTAAAAEGQTDAKKADKSESSLAVKEKTGAIKPSTFSYLGDRYVSPGDIEIAESFISAGLRPVAASHLEVFGTILNGRPIEASGLQVMDYAVPGQRPVFNSGVIVKDDLTLPGGRPIVASEPALVNAEFLIGGRPIASNDIIDPEPATLMGYLD